jgi:hypothetical protein
MVPLWVAAKLVHRARRAMVFEEVTGTSAQRGGRWRLRCNTSGVGFLDFWGGWEVCATGKERAKQTVSWLWLKLFVRNHVGALGALDFCS